MMNFFRKRLNKKGFTLVELLIVIAVLGIIAGIGVSTMGGVTDTFKVKADQETGRMLARQVEVKVLAGLAKEGTTIDEDLIPELDNATPQSGGTKFTLEIIDDTTDKWMVRVDTDDDSFDAFDVDIADGPVDDSFETKETNTNTNTET